MRRVRLVVSFLMCVALAFSAGIVVAAPEDDARALLKEGNRLLEAGDYVHALEKFQAGYAIVPSPKILLNIGTTLRELGRFNEAMAAYERYLASPSPDAAMVAQVDEILKELATKVGHVRGRVTPATAEVLIDGESVIAKNGEFKQRVDPGTHSIVAQLPGNAPAVSTVKVDAGAEVEVTLEVQAQPAPVLSGPFAPPRVASPAKRIIAPPLSPARLVAGYAVAGVGVLGFVAAAVTGGLVEDRHATVERECPEALEGACFSQAGLDAAAEGRSLVVANAVAFAVGFAGVTVGVPLIVSWYVEEANGAAKRAGLSIRGAF